MKSENMIDTLLTDVLPEKKGVIGKHDENTADREEKEILRNLEAAS